MGMRASNSAAEPPGAPSQQPGTSALPAALSLRGRTVVVTGAANGIGRATAAALAGLGADLLLVDLQPLGAVKEALDAAAADCSRVRTLQADMTAGDFIAQLTGSGPFYALAHCAAVHYSDDWSLADRPAQFHKVMDMNVRVPLELGVAALEHMVSTGGGRIVLTGSAAGRSGGTSANAPPDYAASKGAVHTVVRWLSRRAVGRGVMVNGVAPGPVRTAMTVHSTINLAQLPTGRMAEPEEIAWAIAFLCSPAASYVSGAILDVNGGSFVG